jgi:hypothetical protein
MRYHFQPYLSENPSLSAEPLTTLCFYWPLLYNYNDNAKIPVLSSSILPVNLCIFAHAQTHSHKLSEMMEMVSTKCLGFAAKNEILWEESLVQGLLSTKVNTVTLHTSRRTLTQAHKKIQQLTSTS